MKQSAPDLERRSPNSGPWVTPPQIDLSSCAREPIHIPGAVQPHGAVLAAQFPVDASNLTDFGADAVLLKPFATEELMGVLAHLLNTEVAAAAY